MNDELPIICSAAEVQAILARRKTQVRKVIYQLDLNDGRQFLYHDEKIWASLKAEELAPLKEGPPHTVFGGQTFFDGDGRHVYTPIVVGGYRGHPLTCPYGRPGDRLYVREPLQCDDSGAFYAADRAPLSIPADYDRIWRQGRLSAMHMPRWASRITLENTGVRFERLQDMSADDLTAEGFPPHNGPMRDGTRLTLHGRRMVFAECWDHHNGNRGYGWDTNPPVWVISFKLIET